MTSGHCDTQEMKTPFTKPLDTLPETLQAEGREKLEAFVKACEEEGIKSTLTPRMVSEASRVFALSGFATRSAIRNPGIFMDLVLSGDLVRPYGEGAYVTALKRYLSGVGDESALAGSLRRFRCREMVRIAWRDLLGLAGLPETMADLTRFADAIIDEALFLLYSWQCEEIGIPKNNESVPQRLAVIGMGKLGGEELNFSSDVDLIFAYPESGKTQGETVLTNDEFFSRLCRSLIRILGSPSADGIVFRVDMRLRPDGENGPIVMDFDNTEHYYQNHGREWERYAWIKARAVAGDIQAGERLIRRLNPFVFRRYLDYGMFEALRDMKRKISLEVRKRKLDEDIKIGPGGIREIEFFGQVFQLIRGGVIPALQTRRIQKVLEALAEQGIITQAVRQALSEAYVFLRTTEHRLQEFADQQTHRLPREDRERLKLAVSSGFADWGRFESRLNGHRKRVHEAFQGLLKVEHAQGSEAGRKEEGAFGPAGVWQGLLTREQAGAVLTKMGFTDTGQALKILEHLRIDPATRSLSPEGRRRLDRLMPMILEAASGVKTPLETLSRLCEIVRAIERRTSYLALLLENPPALTHLMRLVNASPWIADFLKQHPVLLDELLDLRVLLKPPQKAALRKEIGEKTARVEPEELEQQIETLCIFKQVNTLRVAASDITGVLPLMKVSDHLSYIAEVVLEEVLELAWRHLAAKHGKPRCILDGTECDRGFVMIAYGKLGGIELGYRSDLDLVFLHAGTPGQTHGGRPMDNAQFFARLGQRVIHILTAHTRAGVLYEIDMRLRPSGASGILVSAIEAFREYQLDQAWTWEHQALVRARAIGGDPVLARRFEAIRKEALARPREKDILKAAVREMREKMRREHLKPEPGVFDLKESRGGLVDVEFIVQYLTLLHAWQHPQIVTWTDNVRLLQSLMETGVIGEKTAYLLRRAFLTYRASIHRLNLREKPARIPSDSLIGLRKAVRRFWADFLEG